MDVYEFLDKLNLKRTNKKVDELHDRLSKICENLIKTFELNNVSVICCDKNFKYGDRHHRVIYLQDIFEIKIDGKFYYADLEIVIRSDNHNRIFFDIEKIVSEDIEDNYKIDDALNKVFIDCCYKKYAEISKQLWLMNSEDLYNKTYFDFDYYDRKKDTHDMDYNSVVLLLTEIYKEARKLRGLNYGKIKFDIDIADRNTCSVCGGKLESALYLDGNIKDENGNRCFTQLIECENEEDYRILRYCTECGLLFVKNR